MSYLEPRELTEVRELFNAGKLDDALTLFDNLPQIDDLDIHKKGYYIELKARILLYQGKDEEAKKLGDKLYRESQKLNEKLLSFDGLNIIIFSLNSEEKFDEALDLIEQAEILLKNISNASHRDLLERKARIYCIKANIILMKGDLETAKTLIDKTISFQKELGITLEMVWSHLLKAMMIRIMLSRFDVSLEYIKKALSMAEEIEFNHIWKAYCHLNFGVVYGQLGEIDLCLEHEMKSLEIFRKINNKRAIVMILNNIGASHAIKGENDIALKYFEEGLLLQKNDSAVAPCLTNMAHIAIEEDDIELGKQYFQKLKDIYNKKKEKRIKGYYLSIKAFLLKKSPRLRDRVKAEEIYKQIIEEFSYLGPNFQAYIQLCDLLLMELGFTNNVEVIEEINDYITQMLGLAEKSHSYLMLGETYILQAKLALLTLDLKGAQLLLTKAQEIAEDLKIPRLARKISTEHDELLKQLTIWENIDESKVSLPERLKLTRLNVQMENMTKKRAIDVPDLSDEDSVHLLIISEGGTPIFSHSFITDETFEDDLIGSFFTAINSFINEKFSEGLDRASFGEYTLLMNSVKPFLMCYVYKGQSYPAQQRLRHFIDKFKRNNEIWSVFDKYIQTNQEVQLEDVPSLDSLIKEVFIDKTFLINQ
ncbi:MAG: hypothetical protein ACW98D_07180 [Promethearchaeota archaeon]|jgi:tetratricopeptide (TPR) repeat protein